MNNNLIVQIDQDSETESDVEDDSLGESDEDNVYNDNGNINYYNLTTDKVYKIIEADPIFGILDDLERDRVSLFFLINNVIDYNHLHIIKKNIYFDRCFTSPSIGFVKLDELLFLKDDELFYPEFLDNTTNLLSIKRQNCQSTISNLKKFSKKNESSLINNVLNNSKEFLLGEEIYQNSSILTTIPDEILETIIIKSFDSHLTNIPQFFNQRMTCKRFYRIMNTGVFLDRFISNISSELKIDLYERFYNISNVSFKIYYKVVYSYLFNIFKNYIIHLYDVQIIDSLGGYANFMKLDNIILHTKCLDNLCRKKCSCRYHNILSKVKSPITRGIDSIGRGFVIFLYKNKKSENIHYEIIYNNNIPIPKNTTFSGLYNTTYIGNKSANYKSYTFNMYRTLDYRSYDYIKRLVNRKPTGTVHLNNELVGYEDYSDLVELYYNKEVLRQSIINNIYENFL